MRYSRDQPANDGSGEIKGEEVVEGIVYYNKIDYEFERVVLDEAHMVRNPKTLVSETIRQVRKRSVHFLTATPMLNHPRDLRGLLSLIWDPNWSLYNVQTGFLECYEADFNPRAVVLPGEDDDADDEVMDVVPPAEHPEWHAAFTKALGKGHPVWLLDPNNYRACGSRGLWSPEITAKIIPPILRLLELRLTMASAVDLGDGKPARRVADEVPPCHIYSIELQMAPREQRIYNETTRPVMKQLFKGDTSSIQKPTSSIRFSTSGNSELPEGVQDSGIYRLLMHTVLDPRLATLTTRHRKGTSRKERRASANNWVTKDGDYGASYYHRATRHGPEYVVPVDRLSLAVYMSAFSVKIRYALYLVGEFVLKEKTKVILVFEFPMSQW